MQGSFGRLAALAAIMCAGPATATVSSAATPIPRTVLTPGVAPEAAAPEFKADPDELPGVAAAAEAERERDPALRLPMLTKALALLPRPTRVRGVVLAALGATLYELQQPREALGKLEEAHALLPDASRTTVFLAVVLESLQQDRRAATLLAEAATQDPEALFGTDPDMYIQMFRRLGYADARAERRRLIKALVTSGYAAANPLVGNRIANVEIADRLSANDLPGATQALALISDPQIAVDLIINRRYAALWPAIDAWAGGDLHDLRIARLTAARTAWKLKDEPTIDETIDYATTLADTGNVPDALKVAQAVLADPARWDADRYRAQRLANTIARWQAESGDTLGAIATGERFLAVTPLDKFPQAANFATNHALRLAEAGRGTDAMAWMDRLAARTDDPDFEGKAAHLWFDAIVACAAMTGPRHVEAEAALARVNAGAVINPAALSTALACRGDIKALKRVAIAAMTDGSERDAMIDRLRRLPAWPTLASTSDRSWRRVAADADVITILDRYSRPLPPGYLAAARKWR